MTISEPDRPADQAEPDQPAAEQPPNQGLTSPLTRRPRLLWVAGAVLVVLALVGGIALAVRQQQPAASSVPAETPQQAVRGYLDALVALDADRALEYAVSKPTNTAMLSREVLAQSQKVAPLAVVEVPEVEGAGPVQVPAKVTFGGQESTITFSVSRGDSGWRLGQITSLIDPGGLATAMKPTLNGQPLAGTGHLEVFPGVYTFGEGLKEINFAESEVRVVAVGEDVRAGLQPTLTKAGTDRANAIALASLKACMAKQEPTPEGCPNRVRADTGQKLSTKSIKWDLVGNPWKNATYTLDVNDPTQARGAATLQFRFRGTLTQGGATYAADQVDAIDVRYLLTVTDSKVKVAWQRIAS